MADLDALRDLIRHSRERIAPFRRDVDAGRWVTHLGTLLAAEALIKALEQLLDEHEKQPKVDRSGHWVLVHFPDETLEVISSRAVWTPAKQQEEETHE